MYATLYFRQNFSSMVAIIVVTILFATSCRTIEEPNHDLCLQYKKIGWFGDCIHEKLLLVNNGKKLNLTDYSPGAAAEISKDGSYVLYAEICDSDQNGRVDAKDKSHLILFDVQQQAKCLVMTNADSLFGSWSPDGTSFAFSAKDRGTSCVYISSCPLGTMKCIAHDIGWGGHVAWSPNGKWIAFYSSDADGSYLRLYDVIANQLVYKSPEVGNGWMVRWSVLRNSIIFLINGQRVSLIPEAHVLSINPSFDPAEDRRIKGWPPDMGY